MSPRRIFRTDWLWVLITAVLIISAVVSLFWVASIDGYRPELLWDMIPHALSGAAICAFLLNFNISRSSKRYIAILPLILLTIIPAVIITLAFGILWEAVEVYMPWLGFFAWDLGNIIRDIIADVIGAVFTVIIYYYHYEALEEIQKPDTEPTRVQDTSQPPGRDTMNYCDNCGSVMPTGEHTCDNCGARG
jgi:hypothetical protein